MNPLGKILIVAGLVLLVSGLWVLFGRRLPWIGHLPGDINIESHNYSLHFPVVTCLIISIVATIIMNLLFRRH